MTEINISSLLFVIMTDRFLINCCCVQEKPADGVLLQMKAMNIDKVVNFPFPSPPDKVQLRTAEERLQMLGLLSLPPPNIPLKVLF